MPILITGFITLLLVFYSGYAIRGQNSATISEMVASSFLYSMLISWLIFLVAYFLDLETTILSILIIAITGLCYWFGHSRQAELSTNNINNTKNLPLTLLVLILASVVVFFTFLYIQKFYNPIFIFWDAVVAYNRWAIELANGEYRVGGAAYPILYPGLWSLIYRLQDDSTFWIISKATLLVAPITLFVYSISLSLERRSLFPILFIIGCSVLVIFRTPYFLSGMMDIAVVVLGMLTCLILWKESTQEETESLSLLAAGLTSLVKQAGLAFLLLSLLMKLTEKGPKALLSNYWKPLLVALALPLSFLGFFIYHNDFQQIISSFSGLKKVAESAASGSEISHHALELVKSYLPIKITLPIGLLLLFGMISSPARLRLLSILSLIIAAIGFLIWMLYSSYDIRNLYWSIILIIFATTIGLDALITKVSDFMTKSKTTKNSENIIQVTKNQLLKRILITLPLLSLIPIISAGEDQLVAINNFNRDEVIPSELRSMFERSRLGFPTSYIVITNVQPLIWAPKLKGRIKIDNFRGKYPALKNKLNKSEAHILLVKKLPDGGGYPNIKKLAEDQLIKQVADSNLYSIYLIQRHLFIN